MTTESGDSLVIIVIFILFIFLIIKTIIDDDSFSIENTKTF